MKGLLTKDIALFLQRKKAFIFLAIWAVVMCITMDDGSFMVGWLTVITAFFSVSSYTYDEYDNCYPFLMTLPVDGKTYVYEKYLFGFLCGFSSWLFAVAVYFISVIAKGSDTGLASELVQLAIFIPVFMLLIDFSLPINIKFGSERGRMVILIIFAVVFLGIFAADKLLKIDFTINDAETFGLWLVPAAFAVCAVLTAVSIEISVRIMNSKEY